MFSRSRSINGDDSYINFEFGTDNNNTSPSIRNGRRLIIGIFCTSVLTMLMVIIMIGVGSYAYTSQHKSFEKASVILNLMDENSVSGAIEYANKLDTFVKTLNISLNDVENGILIGLEVGEGVASIPNITEFFHDIAYLVDTMCYYLPCDKDTYSYGDKMVETTDNFNNPGNIMNMTDLDNKYMGILKKINNIRTILGTMKNSTGTESEMILRKLMTKPSGSHI